MGGRSRQTGTGGDAISRPPRAALPEARVPAGSGCCPRPLPGPDPPALGGGLWPGPTGDPGQAPAGCGPPGFPAAGAARAALPALPALGWFPSAPLREPPWVPGWGPVTFPAGFGSDPRGSPLGGPVAAARPVGPGVPGSSRFPPKGSAPARTLTRRPAAGAPHAPSPGRDPGQTGTRRGWGSPGAAGDPSCRRAPSSRHRRRLVFSPQLLPGAAAGRTDPSGLALALPEPGRARTAQSVLWWEQRPLQAPTPAPAAPRARRWSRPGRARAATAIPVPPVLWEVSAAQAMPRGCADASTAPRR
ncbi:uncharacterized protein WM294_003154 [Sarcoramphus papa]